MTNLGPIQTAIEPNPRAAQELLAKFSPELYAATRNQLDGAVSKLSAYLTHGFLSLSEVFSVINARHPLDMRHKFVFELGWRAYYRHVWHFLGEGIHRSLHQGPLPDPAYCVEMPDDVLEGRTGIPVIDLAVRELYRTGYLHNHARMWLASYLVHVRKIHWHCGAQWMLGHLVDGDLASNHLSWQWVAGTGSVKPYLFNAQNVAKFAPAQWHSPNTVIDTSYEALSSMAFSSLPSASDNESSEASVGLQEPHLSSRPIDLGWQAPNADVVQGRDIWLIHPWSLAGPGSSLPAGALCIGVAFTDCHSATPWSAKRWDFVTRGIKGQSEHLWWGDTELIASALREARSVHWRSEPHADQALLSLRNRLSLFPRPTRTLPHVEDTLFESISNYCPSFSQWWRRTRLRV